MKLFDKPLTVIELRKNLKKLAQSVGVKRITYNKKAIYLVGSYSYVRKTMFLSLRQTKQETLITFFHELAHHVACTRGWWKSYHLNDVTNSKKAFIIENHIDKLGQKLWNRYVDQKVWGKYKFAYAVSKRREQIKALDTIYGLD
jgi:hypothetical protein